MRRSSYGTIDANSMPINQRRDGETGSRKAILDMILPEFLRDGFAGAASGVVARTLTAPFDVAKIRFQLDHSADPRYRSLLEAIRSIYGEEGLVSLWRGNVPAMFLWMTFGAVQFSTYEYLQKVDFLRAKLAPARTVSSDAAGTWERASNRWDNDKDDRVLPKTASNFVYGAIAGSAGTVASYPFDITRTALAYQGVPKRYSGVADFLNKAVREAGPWGLFRGLSPTITMIAPQIGIGFAVYELVKANPPTWLEGAPPSRGQSLAIAEPMVDRAEEVTGSDSEGARSGVDRIDVDVRHGREVRAEKGKADHAGRSRLEAMWPMVAGGVSGMTSKLAVFPLDTLKKRVQAQVMQRDLSYGILPKYAGPMDALRTILRDEGIAALFRGSMSAILKSGLSTGLTFVVYEWFKVAMKI